jgi:hypothetical protein
MSTMSLYTLVVTCCRTNSAVAIGVPALGQCEKLRHVVLRDGLMLVTLADGRAKAWRTRATARARASASAAIPSSLLKQARPGVSGCTTCAVSRGTWWRGENDWS